MRGNTITGEGKNKKIRKQNKREMKGLRSKKITRRKR